MLVEALSERCHPGAVQTPRVAIGGGTADAALGGLEAFALPAPSGARSMLTRLPSQTITEQINSGICTNSTTITSVLERQRARKGIRFLPWLDIRTAVALTQPEGCGDDALDRNEV